jgi:hypothetical protein
MPKGKEMHDFGPEFQQMLLRVAQAWTVGQMNSPLTSPHTS